MFLGDKSKVSRGRMIVIASVAVVATVACALLIVSVSDNEPTVEGRRLSGWLLDLKLESGEKQERAVKAVSLAGTNALPFLVDELTTVHSARKKAFLNWVVRQPWLYSVRRALNVWRDPSEEAHRSRAKAGFAVLGHAAQPAFPLLTNALTNSAVSLDVAEVLVSSDERGKLFFGPEIESALSAVIEHDNPEVRRLAVYGIARSQTNVETSVRYLLAAFKDQDSRVREAAVLSVGGVYKQKHADIVPALIKTIEDPSPDVRKKAVTMLGWYGALARDALPVLERLMTDPDSGVQNEARIAVSRIKTE
jgi:hypothetical protein